MKIFSMIFFLLLSFSILCAQANKDYDGVKPEVYKGSRALVFTYTPFQSNLGLVPTGSANAGGVDDYLDMPVGGIGIKFFASDQMSMLFSLGFGRNSIEKEDDTGSKYDLSRIMYGAAVDIDYRIPSLYSISTYIGLNVNYGAYDVEDITSNLLNVTKVEYTSDAFGIGLNIGFDWFFTEGISLGGKYTLGYKSYDEPEYKVITGTNTATEKGQSVSTFGTGVGTFVLSVHF